MLGNSCRSALGRGATAGVSYLSSIFLLVSPSRDVLLYRRRVAKPDVPKPGPRGVVFILAGAGKGDKSLSIARLMDCLFAINSQ